MSLLQQALRAGSRDPVTATPRRPRGLLVAGGAGPLGSAVLERALALGPWRPVTALVTQPIEVALEGLRVTQAPADWSMTPEMSGQVAECALIVFDRDASAHGREAAFLRPQPAELPALAAWLQRAGVRRVTVVLPHAPALLPAALKAGLASLDEQAVAALGFEQFTLVRPTRSGPAGEGVPAGGRLHRLARALLSQLHWMIPQREQPLRAAKVAEFVIELARRLPDGAHGTRVVPPELLWDWAQPDGGERVLQAWLGCDIANA